MYIDTKKLKYSRTSLVHTPRDSRDLYSLSGVVSIENTLLGLDFVEIFVRNIRKLVLIVFVLTRLHCNM